jgi:hypothetical protein
MDEEQRTDEQRGGERDLTDDERSAQSPSCRHSRQIRAKRQRQVTSRAAEGRADANRESGRDREHRAHRDDAVIALHIG